MTPQRLVESFRMGVITANSCAIEVLRMIDVDSADKVLSLLPDEVIPAIRHYVAQRKAGFGRVACMGYGEVEAPSSESVLVADAWLQQKKMTADDADARG